MRKTVLTFGLVAGAILSVMMLITLPFHEQIGFDRAEIIGYTTMVLAFLLIFFGVRSYRDNVGGGRISFGRAMAVGSLIAVVASACYVVTWEILYFNFMPEFATKMQEHAMEEARAEGKSDPELAMLKAQMDRFAAWYRNPALNAAITFLEPLPVALVMTLVSAGVLSRRRRSGEGSPVMARAS